MKKFLLSSLIAAAAAVPALAGVDNINYQAVIKNGSEVVADKKVSLKFELFDKSENVVYSEIQDVTTNAAGYVSCQLGQDKDLSEIEWGDLTLSVSVDLGSGYQALSIEDVSSVPSALYALRSADSDKIKEDVKSLMQIIQINSNEIEKLNGLTEEFATIEQVDNFASMLEIRLDKIESGASATDNDLENIKENLTNAFTGVNAEIAEINGQLENLNNVSAVVRANEEAIEGLQGDFKNLDENLTNAFTGVNAEIAEINGQLENLNNVSAVVRANEAAIEKLNTDTEAFATMNEARIDKLQKQVDSLEEEVAGLKDMVSQLIEALRELEVLPSTFK